MSFISRIRRADGVTPLCDEDIHRHAPSALATEAHESRSARYAYIPTAEVIASMRESGFLPMAAAQARTRDPGRAGHTKHMLRFRHAGAGPITERGIGATFPEIVLLNSHDGTGAYHVMSGVFRLVCLNGMVVPSVRFAVRSEVHPCPFAEPARNFGFGIARADRPPTDAAQRPSPAPMRDPRPLSRWHYLRLWLRREARRMRAMLPGPWGGPHVGGGG